mmetsp:Transcript_9472/g.22057  ORF Transcript_9472/g.22057 Transcript_9472/m.22057 type:complete len:276 (-) Transcript_9472:2589-3416(-)
MRTIDPSSNSVKAMMLKWRMKRPVMGLRPPPGGPIAPMKVRSTILRKEFSFRSYQPPWSIHCLSSSIGGCAPYSSSTGMLRSSTRKMQRMPCGGPSTNLRRLSSLASMMSCTCDASVRAEKVKNCVVHLLASSALSSALTVTVLPVPVGPQTSAARLQSSSVRTVAAMRTESTVGTVIELASTSDGTLNSGTVSIHEVHLQLLASKQMSKSDSLSGKGVLRSAGIAARSASSILGRVPSSAVPPSDQTMACIARPSSLRAKSAGGMRLGSASPSA